MWKENCPFFGLIVHSEVLAFHIIFGSGKIVKHRPCSYGPNWTVKPCVIDIAGELFKLFDSCFLLKHSEDEKRYVNYQFAGVNYQ